MIVRPACLHNRPKICPSAHFKFTCDVYDYCEDLVRLRGFRVGSPIQLFDAAGSVGANRAESKSSYSDKEFAAKNAICLKECREARFWLRVADAKRLGNEGRRKYLLQESNELVSIYVVIVWKIEGKPSFPLLRLFGFNKL